jgi:hypothetical protein
LRGVERLQQVDKTTTANYIEVHHTVAQCAHGVGFGVDRLAAVEQLILRHDRQSVPHAKLVTAFCRLKEMILWIFREDRNLPSGGNTNDN